MAGSQPQAYATHRKYVPIYHFFAATVLLINLVWAGWKLVQSLTSADHAFGFDHVLGLLVAMALIVIWLYARLFPLAVQDRLIRLEQQLRMANQLPADLNGRVDELKRGQFVALRFAGDDELADRVREALDEGLKGEQIKKRIKNWKPDHFRC
ncbi:MAG: DUF6526 family protein [Acidobacteriota bacterium]